MPLPLRSVAAYYRAIGLSKATGRAEERAHRLHRQGKEGHTMTPSIRWRIITLQVVMVVLLASMAGVVYAASNFTTNYVHDELTTQKITFPAASSPAITSLPAADREAMTQYAGQAL